jgi:hypothetical protein
MEEGEYEVEVYYTCPAEDIGSTGMEYDRYPRKVSYIKDFIPLKMGTIHLGKGKGTLVLKATDMPGSQGPTFSNTN